MTDHTSQELQRILGNPENEIISDSLKERLGHSSKFDMLITFGEVSFECALDSFSMSSKSTGISRVSLLVGPKVVHKLLANSSFVINCKSPDIYIVSDSFETIDCFKYNNDVYVLELFVAQGGVLND